MSSQKRSSVIKLPMDEDKILQNLDQKLEELFRAEKTTTSNSEEREMVFTRLQTVRLKDARLKYWARIIGGSFLCLLLLVQNVLVVLFIWAAYNANRLSELTIIFSVIIPATLAESAAIVHTAVKWIFADTDYKRHK